MQGKNTLDSAVFDPSLIDQETIQLNEKIENLLNDLPPAYNLTPQIIRDAEESGKGILGKIVLVDEAEERAIPGSDGDIPIRVFIPEEVNGIYLHFHGGGFLWGTAHNQDPLLLSMAKGLRLR